MTIGTILKHEENGGQGPLNESKFIYIMFNVLIVGVSKGHRDKQSVNAL